MGDFLQWNINGLKCTNSQNYKEKIDTVCSILENSNTSILNLQETHFQQDDFPQCLKNYEHLFHFINSYATDDDPSAGILLCVSKKFEIEEIDLIENGRLIYANIKNNDL